MFQKAQRLYSKFISLLMFPLFIFIIILLAFIDRTCSFLDSLILVWGTVKQFYKDEFSKKPLPINDAHEDFWNAS
jgi:hypothetical protein